MKFYWVDSEIAVLCELSADRRDVEIFCAACIMVHAFPILGVLGQ